MPKLLNSLGRALGQIPKPAWVHCPGQRSFCCCLTVRSGASVIGWFNFIFNSLYVGMMVFALARKKESVSEQINTLRSIPDSNTNSEGSANISIMPDDLSTTHVIAVTTPLHESCNSGDYWEQCLCNAKLAKSLAFSTTAACPYFSHYSKSSCICNLGKISFEILPMIYKSLVIPGVLIVISMLWLTTVESNSIRFLRFVGFVFFLAIPIQLLFQLYFQVYANRKLTQSGIGALNGVVWFIYVVYALLNVYFLPVLYRYIKLRTKEHAQGLDQGLLTSERRPPTNQSLDVYLEDAFAISSDMDSDPVWYRTGNKYEINDLNEETEQDVDRNQESEDGLMKKK